MEELLEKYGKLPVKNRRLGGVAILLLLLGGYWYLFASEAASKIERLSRTHRNLEAEANDKRASLANLAKFEAKILELQQQLDVARAKLPDTSNMPEFLSQIGNSARKAGLVISEFEPKGETRQGFFAEISVDMKVTGSYHEIGTFIDSIGRLDRIVNVSDITMDNPKTQNQKIVVVSTFRVKTYRYVGEG